MDLSALELLKEVGRLFILYQLHFLQEQKKEEQKKLDTKHPAEHLLGSGDWQMIVATVFGAQLSQLIATFWPSFNRANSVSGTKKRM